MDLLADINVSLRDNNEEYFLVLNDKLVKNFDVFSIFAELGRFLYGGCCPFLRSNSASSQLSCCLVTLFHFFGNESNKLDTSSASLSS